jgi:hypothetical protein
MMEAAKTSEMLINFYQTIQRYNPEDSHLHLKQCFYPFWYHRPPLLSTFLVLQTPSPKFPYVLIKKKVD